MDLREILLAVIFTAIAVVVALNVYPTVHNAVNFCNTYNGTHTTDAACTSWKNTSPVSGVESAMLGLITLIFPAAIALTPVTLLYVMSHHK
jgi:hypothetical protein